MAKEHFDDDYSKTVEKGDVGHETISRVFGLKYVNQPFYDFEIPVDNGEKQYLELKTEYQQLRNLAIERIHDVAKEKPAGPYKCHKVATYYAHLFLPTGWETGDATPVLTVFRTDKLLPEIVGYLLELSRKPLWVVAKRVLRRWKKGLFGDSWQNEFDLIPYEHVRHIATEIEIPLTGSLPIERLFARTGVLTGEFERGVTTSFDPVIRLDSVTRIESLKFPPKLTLRDDESDEGGDSL